MCHLLFISDSVVQSPVCFMYVCLVDEGRLLVRISGDIRVCEWTTGILCDSDIDFCPNQVVSSRNTGFSSKTKRRQVSAILIGLFTLFM